MALMPYMKKRVVKIDREQLDLLLTHQSLKIEDLKDNFKAILPKGKFLFTINSETDKEGIWG